MTITPRVSILIPNFNNGRSSSRSGERDFLGDLFTSLHTTLRDDPTPLEILVYDDGSTDDSLATCRSWAAKTWGGHRGDQPFLELTEHAHCGILSIVANRLTERARGEYCCRLDGDIICLTPNWAEEVCRIFDQGPPALGVIGPKQLGVDGRIHSAGSWILHPRGHHHVAQGAITETITRAMEVDHVMGCFYCHRRSIWDELGGYDETILRGQTVDFGLRARLNGWRAFAVPSIAFIHAHALRAKRANDADSRDGVERTLNRFYEKWGFDRLAPDLDEVAARYGGTPLLWNARVFGPATNWPPASAGPIDPQQTDWARYATEDGYRHLVDARVNIVDRLKRTYPSVRRVLHVRSRSGLLCHLLSCRGFTCTGVDNDANWIDLARQMTGKETYPERRPSFLMQNQLRRLPIEDGSFDAVLLFDLLETHPNPVGLFKEAHRALKPGGVTAIVTRERTSPFDSDHDAVHAYRGHELVLQLQGSRCFAPVSPEGVPPLPVGGIVLFGERRDEEAPTLYRTSRESSNELVAAGAAK